MKVKFFYVIIINMVFIPLTFSMCDQETKRDIINNIKTPYKIYEQIQKKFNLVINQGFDSQYFSQVWGDWNKYTDCANSIINKPQYKEYLKEINKAKELINEVAKKLDKGEQLAQTYVSIVKGTIEQLMVKLDIIFNAVLRNIYESTIDIPATWKKGVLLTTASEIFSEYEGFFKRYYEAKKKFEDKKQPFSPDRIEQFVSTQFTSRAKPTTKMKNMALFVDTLQQFKYRLEEDMKKAWFGKTEMEKKIDASEEIIQALLKKYPSITTSLMYQKILLTKDAAAQILLAETASLYTLLQILFKYLFDKFPNVSVTIRK